MRYVVIPVYINSQHLMSVVRGCVKSYYENKLDSILVCVDDCSPTPITLGSDVEFSTPQNLGYTGCVNVGLRFVLQEADDEDIVFIVNDDIEFIPEWWRIGDKLTDDVGVVSALVSDEPPLPRNQIFEDKKFGSYWAIKVKTLRKLGLLNENLKAYFSDTDYFKRLKDNGYRVIKDTSVFIPHAGNQTYGSLEDNEEQYARDAKAYEEEHGRLD